MNTKHNMAYLFYLMLVLLVVIDNTQGKGNDFVTDSCQTAQQFQQVKTWKFRCNNKEMGKLSDYIGSYSTLLVHNRKIYFVDDVLSRVNCIDLSTGKVIWGKKKTLKYEAEHIAYFANHIVIFSQFGIQTLDSLLKTSNILPFHKSFFPNVIMSRTDRALVALSTFEEFNDTGTGQRFYAQYLTLDTSFNYTESIKFLGQTSHLDARHPPNVDSLNWRLQYMDAHMSGGNPFIIRVIGIDTCIYINKKLLQLPKQVSFSEIKYSLALDSDLLAFWEVDSNNRFYTITLYDYSKK